MFKIVDGFYGANGGDSYFGCCDEVRDIRRFQTREEATVAIEEDRSEAEQRPPARRSLSQYQRTSPDKDRWGRRFDNLRIVPETHRWCVNSDGERWAWQLSGTFEFGPPLQSGEQTMFRVSRDMHSLGLISREDNYRWRVEGPDFESRDFISAYQAAHALLVATNSEEDR